MAININNETFHITTSCTSYIFDVYKGYLRHIYYGKKIEGKEFGILKRNYRVGCVIDAGLDGYDGSSLDIFPQELGLYGVGDFRENGVLVTDANGVSSGDFKYEGYIIHENKPEINLPSARGEQTLEVRLYDPAVKIRVKLFYTPDYQTGAIARRTEIENESNLAVQVKRIDSFMLDISDKGYSLIAFSGVYGCERMLVNEKITYGVKKYRSVKGNCSSHQTTPFIGVSTNGLNENLGEVIGALLLYSGSFAVGAERGQCSDIRLFGGMGDDNFCWKLFPNESLSSAEAVLFYSEQGLGGASRAMHDFIREKIIPENFAYASRPIVANTWEGCYMNIDVDKLKRFTDNAAKIGAEMVVLDDGWFIGRDNDKTSLGDWEVDKRKLPNGIDEIIDYAKKQGLEFGLWIEPEMISEKSNLFKNHPEWVVQVKNRAPKLGRNQMVLDFSNPEVIKYVKGVFDNILGNHDISYVKWDCNRYLTENYSLTLPPDRQGEFTHRYVLGLYEVLSHIRKKYPKVLIEGCAGGGGRFDAGMLCYTPQIWTSDATDADARTLIQYGTSVVYPTSAISAHVSDIPNVHTKRNIDLYTRANVASMGVYGYEMNFLELERTEELLSYTQRYKSIRELGITGDLFRLASPFDSNYFAFMILSKDKSKGYGVYYRRNTSYVNNQPHRIYLKGLDENKIYEIPQTNIVASGSVLANLGITIDFCAIDHTSVYFDIIERK